MKNVTVKTNIASVLSELDAFGRKQVPFASAKALNDLAYALRDETRSNLGDYFTLRTSWLERGIQVGDRAKKSDFPRQSVSVGSRDAFMAIQALGGVKRGTKGNMAVPVEAREQLGGSKGTLGRSTWPSRVKGRKRGSNRNKFFVQKLKSGPSAGLEAVLRRDTSERYPLQVIYVMKPDVKINATWKFYEDGEAFVQKNYNTFFGRALARAIATGR